MDGLWMDATPTSPTLQLREIFGMREGFQIAHLNFVRIQTIPGDSSCGAPPLPALSRASFRCSGRWAATIPSPQNCELPRPYLPATNPSEGSTPPPSRIPSIPGKA